MCFLSMWLKILFVISFYYSISMIFLNYFLCLPMIFLFINPYIAQFVLSSLKIIYITKEYWLFVDSFTILRVNIYFLLRILINHFYFFKCRIYHSIYKQNHNKMRNARIYSSIHKYNNSKWDVLTLIFLLTWQLLISPFHIFLRWLLSHNYCVMFFKWLFITYLLCLSHYFFMFTRSGCWLLVSITKLLLCQK